MNRLEFWGFMGLHFFLVYLSKKYDVNYGYLLFDLESGKASEELRQGARDFRKMMTRKEQKDDTDEEERP